jgi:hypothetical protein
MSMGIKVDQTKVLVVVDELALFACPFARYKYIGN